MKDKNPHLFSPINYKRSSENVMEQILARIEEGSLRPGDKLDSERVLATEFGVSQPCVREALRALELMGIVRVERGKGAFVLDSIGVESQLSIWKKWANLNCNEVMEILEVRSALDAKIITLICNHYQEIDFSELEHTIDQMRQYAEEKPVNKAQCIKMDMRFHVLLAELSGNKLLASLTATVNNLISMDRQTVFSWSGRLDASIIEHKGIIAALKQGDAAKAQQLMDIHMLNTQKAFEEVIGEKVDKNYHKEE